MDMNPLNAAIRMSRAQTSDMPPLPFPATMGAAGLPGFFPSPTSFFKPGAAPVDWSLYGSLVRGASAAMPAAGTSSQKSATDRHDPTPSTSSAADQPLDLSLGPDKLNKPSSSGAGTPVAGSSSPRVPGIHATSDMAAAAFAPLDLTKSRVGKHAATVSPKSPISASKGSATAVSIYEAACLTGNYASASNMDAPAAAQPDLTAASKISLNCRRCSFTCHDTLDFQKHFTQVHSSMPSMNDIIVTSGTTRPSHTITHSAAATPTWPPKVPTPKESVLFHCSHCGWQCDISNAELFTKHVTEHVSDSGNSYKCFYCKTDYHDPNHLREHIAAHAGINQYICSFCCIAFSSETMATAHMEQKHGLSLTHTDGVKWPVSGMKMPSQSAFSVGSHPSSLLNIKKEAPEIVTARVPPSYRSDVAMHTKMAAVSPMSRPISNPSPESSKSNDSNSGPGSTGSFKPLVMKKTGFGQSLAKHIEAAISRELMGNKSPTMSDLMFMKSTGGEAPENGAAAAAKSSASDGTNPLNLMSLLDKVVEESLRNVPIGSKPEKPDLKFMVSFSDEEDEGAAASKEKGSSSSGSTSAVKGGKLSPNSTAKDEAIVSSSETALSRSSSKDSQERTETNNQHKNVPSPQPSQTSLSVKTSSVAAAGTGASRESEEVNPVKDMRQDSSKRPLQDNQQETGSQEGQPECKRERLDSS